MAWNRARTRYTVGEQSALDWSFAAMVETIDRLPRVKEWDGARAITVIGEAVWWVTIVDATLFRYHPDAYEDTLDGLPAAERRLTEGTFTGLRFVRNRMGYYADHADFIQPRRAEDAAGADWTPISEWTWQSLPLPTVESLPPRGQEWEMSRYTAYQDHLAGRTIGTAFDRAAAFLTLAARTADGTGRLRSPGR